MKFEFNFYLGLFINIAFFYTINILFSNKFILKDNKYILAMLSNF